jgi:carbonic anhydrase/acetyltransferase-like protein (isoleucine patch superfamily)
MRLPFFVFGNSLIRNAIGPFLSMFGRRLYALGVRIEGESASEDRLVPSLRKVTHNSKTPQLDNADFVAPNATVVGDVQLGERSSLWYGATVLGTLPIRIGNQRHNVGNGSVIQDRAHLSQSVTIGDNVYVGPNATLQGSKLENKAFVGMGATVRHATVEPDGVVAAGAVVLDNMTVPSLQIWAGNPATFIRNISPVEKQILREHLAEMQSLARIHEEETSKTFRELLSQQESIDPVFIQAALMNSLEELQVPDTFDDDEFIEHRIFLKEKLEYPNTDPDYEPFTKEDPTLPQDFNIGVNKEEHERVPLQDKKKKFQDKEPWTRPF